MVGNYRLVLGKERQLLLWRVFPKNSKYEKTII